MDMTACLVLYCALLVLEIYASENGAYYQCNAAALAANPEYCVFEKTGSAPASWPATLTGLVPFATLPDV